MSECPEWIRQAVSDERCSPGFAEHVAAEFARILRERDAANESVQRLTKQRDHYMAEFNRFDSGYWEVVSDRNAKEAEIERLRAALRNNFKNCALAEANLAECRRLLRELVIGFDNNPRDASSDQRLKLVPIMDKFIEAARAAGGGDE
jgi:CRISPR/Cas system-associated protein endoribonuclease Cas2